MCFRNYFRIRKSSALLVAPENQKTIFKNFSRFRQFLKPIFLSAGLILIFLALLQPQWGKKEQPVMQETRDLLILLDVSHSMLAQDLKPNRLELAKLKVRALLSKLTFERTGLILFSGNAFVQCPLTNDHAAFLMFLDQIDVETISSGTTAIDAAILKAIDVYSKSAGRKNKLALIISDGEDFSLNIAQVKQKAASENIKLFALGLGTAEGAPIPKYDYSGQQTGHEVDNTGSIALSKLNEKMLQNLSVDLGGNYLRATQDDSDIDSIVRTVKGFGKEKFADKKISLYEDQYHWLLGLAWILLALEWLL